MPRKHPVLLLALGLGVLAVFGATVLPGSNSQSNANAQDQPAAKTADDEVIRPIELFVKSYNTRDLKGLAAAWTEKAEYVDEDSGERLLGKKTIVDDFSKVLGKGGEVRLEIDVVQIRKLGDSAAAIEGTTRLFKLKSVPARTKFLALLVRQDGAWLIDNVRESRLESDFPNAEQLEAFAWMNGAWKYVDGDIEVTMDCAEIANGNFRTNRFQAKKKGEIIQEGTQIIGWDAAKKQLRSWVFSGDGSFGEGVVEGDGDRWTARVVGTLPSGAKSSATQIVTRKDATHFTFQSSDRSVDTRVLPNVPEITLTKTVSPAGKEN